MKHPNAVYFCLMSVRGCNCEVTASFSKIRNKIPGELKLAQARSKIQSGLLADGDINDPENVVRVKEI